jgi:co-chaperonin GroES (HSP10)
MSWKTNMAVQVGDEVWFNFISSTHSNGFDIDGEMYLFIPYADCFVAKRGEEVICLNGYILLSEIKKEDKSFLYLAETDKIDLHRGKVRFVGEPNSQYKVDSFSDDIDIAEGDMVQIRAGFTPYRLERQTYLADFGEMLLVVQRRNIDFNYGKD